MPKTPAPLPAASLTFEQAMDELEALVRRMEAGELTLDESIAAYRRGAELARIARRARRRRNSRSASSKATLSSHSNPAELGRGA